MPNIHDGHDHSPATSPMGNLSYSGSHPDAMHTLHWPEAFAEPVSQPKPFPPLAGPLPALHLLLHVKAPPAPIRMPLSVEGWERLGRSVWQANRYLLELPEVPFPESDVPQWLAPVAISVGPLYDDEPLPLRYGIQIDPLPVGPVFLRRRNTRVARFPSPAAVNPALLHFPLGFRTPLPREKVPTIHFHDGVLPFHSRARQTTSVFSLVGGTGVTSIAAGLARTLAGSGLRVLLADTCAHSLLSRLFGGSEVRPGVVRHFVPVTGQTNQMISLVSLGIDNLAGDDGEQYRILDDFIRGAARMDRIVWDLSGAPLEWAAKVLSISPQILIPLLPNMNSMVQLRATERFINRCHEEDPAAQMHYVLNHFDESDPLHVDIRGRFRQMLGRQMLPIALRQSPLVDEALSRGKTVVDHAPASPLVADLWKLAQELHQVEKHAGEKSPESTACDWFEQ